MSGPPGLAALAARIRSLRGCGRVTLRAIERGAGSTAIQVADALGHASGLKAIGQSWRAIDRDDAAIVLARCLRFDLAYHAPLMATNEADALVQAILAFPGDAREFLTNGSWAKPSTYRRGGESGIVVGPSWTPLSTATFDAGVVAVSDERAVICWIEDED